MSRKFIKLKYTVCDYCGKDDLDEAVAFTEIQAGKNVVDICEFCIDEGATWKLEGGGIVVRGKKGTKMFPSN